MPADYERIPVVINSGLLTKVGALLVHPSIELSPSARWSVSARNGIATGKFATRAGAEHYARALVLMADWSTVPDRIDEAMAWASDLYSRKKDAIEDARCEAQNLDADFGVMEGE